MKGISKVHLQLSNDSIQTSDSSTSSSPRQILTCNISKSQNCIKEVYDYNYIEELNIISELLEEYDYIGMDTEFPGTVYNLNNKNDDFYYKILKKNVDSLKIIQLGITLTNEKKKYPMPYHTWQFNFEFDIDKDEFNEQSINLLKKSGIDFDKLKKYGIKRHNFAAYLMTSGLVLNSDVYWISYHGLYDFGYILSLLINENLPKDENEFIEILKIYIPNFYDIKLLVKDIEYLDGGLNKLINELKISRKGTMHQAGSDSIATIESFLKLLDKKIINDAKIKGFRNSLYGIGKGRDNKKTIKYVNKDSNNNVNIIENNCEEKKNDNKYDYIKKLSIINSYNNYNNNFNANNNTKFNLFCPFMFFGNYGMMQNCNCNRFMNNNQIINEIIA